MRIHSPDFHSVWGKSNGFRMLAVPVVLLQVTLTVPVFSGIQTMKETSTAVARVKPQVDVQTPRLARSLSSHVRVAES